MDSNELGGYEGYDYFNTQGGSGPSSDPYVYGSTWEAPRSGSSPSVAASGNCSGAGARQRAEGTGDQTRKAASRGDEESPDSIIAKINQRLDLLSKETGGQDSHESSFRFESFQSFVLPADQEQYRSAFQYGEESDRGAESSAGAGPRGPQASENSSPHDRGRGRGGGGGAAGRRGQRGAGGNRGRREGRGGREVRGGGRGGYHQENRGQNRRGGGGRYYHHREGPPPSHHQHPAHHSHHAQYAQHPVPYGRYGMPPPPPSPSSSERLAARWSDLGYMGPRGMGPRGVHGRLPSLFSSSQPRLPEYHGMLGPPHHPPSHAMMGGLCSPHDPYSGPRAGAWQRNGRNQPRADREGRRQRAGPMFRNTEGRKRRYSQTFHDPDAQCHGTDSEEEEDSEHYEEDNYEEEVEEGTGEEVENINTVKDEEEEEEEEAKKRKRGRKSKERQQKDYRLLFACSLCKFRTAEEKEIQTHLEGRFHKEIVGFLGSKMPEASVRFLQEYLVNRNKRILKRRQELLEKDDPQEKLDPFRGLAQDEFCKRIEAAHCMACDMIIPAQHNLLQTHMSSQEHLRNRKGITEHFKKSSLPVAKSILNNSNISKMLQKYLKGEDPFAEETVNPDPEEDNNAGVGQSACPKKEEGCSEAAPQPSPVAAQEGAEEEVGEQDEEEGDAFGDQDYLAEDVDEEEEDENPMA